MIEQRVNQSGYGEHTADDRASVRREVTERLRLFRVFHHERAQLVAEEYTRHPRLATDHRHLPCVPRHGELIREQSRAIRTDVRCRNDLDVMVKHHSTWKME